MLPKKGIAFIHCYSGTADLLFLALRPALFSPDLILALKEVPQVILLAPSLALYAKIS